MRCARRMQHDRPHRKVTWQRHRVRQHISQEQRPPAQAKCLGYGLVVVMIGPSKLDLMRSVARWGRRLHTGQKIRREVPSVHRPIPTRPPGVAAKQARCHRFRRYARFTLEQMTSVWDGALGVFLPSSAKRLGPRTPTRKGFVPEHFGLSSRATPLGIFAAMRARLPRGPAFVPSLRNGAGFQSARSFSSGPPGARLFETMVTNAPLALRAVGCELDDQWKQKTSVCPNSAFAFSLKAQRYGTHSDQLQTPVVLAKPSSSAPISEAAPCLTESEYEPCMDDLELLFPVPVERMVPRSVVTTMYVPLELDMRAWLQAEDMAVLEESDGAILDTSTKERLCMVRATYRQHAQRLTALEQLLREYGIWPNRLSVQEILRVPRLDDPLALQVEFRGWKKCEVQSLLIRRFGSCEWCTLFEEDTISGLCYGAKEEANAELDLLDPLALASATSAVPLQRHAATV